MPRRDKTRQQPRTRRLPRALLRLAIVLAILVALAPTIAVRTPLVKSLVAGALPPEAGALTLASAGGGWLSPMSAQGIELRDARGELVFEAQEVRLSHGLVGLISAAEPIKVLLVRPTAYLNVRPDGSNVQDLVAAIERAKPPSDDLEPLGGPPEIAGRELGAVAVEQGTLYVAEAASGGRWTHQAINLQVDLAGGPSTLAASATLGSAFNQFQPIADGAPPANFVIKPIAADPAAGNSGQRQFDLELTAAPLNAAEPFARRLDPRLRLTGTATGRGFVSWTPPPPGAPHWADALAASNLNSQGTIAIDQFALQSRLLGGDTLRLSRVEAPWAFVAQNGRLELRDASVVSADIGSLRARGAMSVTELKDLLAQGAAAWRQAGRWPEGRLAADLDLARLAQLAPAAVALRDDVRPVSGRLTAQLETETNAGTKVVGSVTASELVAEAAGKRIGWQQPFTLRGVASRPGGLFTVDALRCESEFLWGDLSGNLTNLTGNLGFDLDKLAEQVGQFVDLRNWRLAGKGNADLRVEAPDAAHRKATLVASMTGVMVARRGEVYLEEEQLEASASADSTLNPAGAPARLEAARVGLQSGGDLLVVDLREPVALDAPAVVALGVELKGGLTSWQNRLRVALAPLGGGVLVDNLRLAGDINLKTDARLGGGVLQLSGLDAAINQLAVDGLGLAVREPRATAKGDFVWDSATSTLESRQGELVTSTLSVASQGVRATAAAGQPAASGKLALRADLARLNNWFAASDRPQAVGQVQGAVEFSQTDGTLRAVLQGAGTNIAFLDAATKRRLLEEPQLAVKATAAYAAATEQLTIESATVTSNTLQVQASGGAQRGATQLNGTVDYDLTALAPVIAGYVGPEVRVSGKHQGRFSLTRTAPTPQPTGPQAPLPWSRAWRGRLEAPWTAISLFGLPIGQGALGVTLADGEVKLDPLNLAVSGGTLTGQLSARLDPPPAVWGVVAGPILTNVQVTPEISERLLKYIAPVLADATRSQGLFSLRVESAGGPLSPLSQLSAKGQLDARSVIVNPGPTTVQWVQLAKQVEALIKSGDATALLGSPADATTLLSISDRTINFTIANGRVFHEGLQFDVGDVSVQSSGSVGFDESLDLLLTIPVKDSWIGVRPLLQGLRGKSVQIPVRGTFGRPNIDERALRDLSKEFVRDGVRGLLRGGLQQLLGE
ncbi:hypothetical protein Pla123a_04830 [Posidoniimonas polymericola]|uniref:Uncharacterized protein n=1 Tax=Posidoniimonas polymericola TaxID=2528002 RepID=A0A5C5ZET6_9BACT|nr:AsmA-like C-terminal region-containing protein [Posidoniimonas polymericola]TWT85676.1 hypothetical protein Pla123a_04830 [Posidoniimonas polymericola]